ncbi:hypothetical protein BGX24_007457 [Mortierella sp. AD032]|nr:hypothetical protein BGX24_007457 [Mortierella sp. AD032]
MAAEHGNAQDKFKVDSLYEGDHSVSKDLFKAEEWCAKAARYPNTLQWLETKLSMLKTEL